MRNLLTAAALLTALLATSPAAAGELDAYTRVAIARLDDDTLIAGAGSDLVLFDLAAATWHPLTSSDVEMNVRAIHVLGREHVLVFGTNLNEFTAVMIGSPKRSRRRPLRSFDELLPDADDAVVRAVERAVFFADGELVLQIDADEVEATKVFQPTGDFDGQLGVCSTRLVLLEEIVDAASGATVLRIVSEALVGKQRSHTTEVPLPEPAAIGSTEPRVDLGELRPICDEGALVGVAANDWHARRDVLLDLSGAAPTWHGLPATTLPDGEHNALAAQQVDALSDEDALVLRRIVPAGAPLQRIAAPGLATRSAGCVALSDGETVCAYLARDADDAPLALRLVGSERGPLELAQGEARDWFDGVPWGVEEYDGVVAPDYAAADFPNLEAAIRHACADRDDDACNGLNRRALAWWRGFGIDGAPGDDTWVVHIDDCRLELTDLSASPPTVASMRCDAPVPCGDSRVDAVASALRDAAGEVITWRLLTACEVCPEKDPDAYDDPGEAPGDCEPDQRETLAGLPIVDPPPGYLLRLDAIVDPDSSNCSEWILMWTGKRWWLRGYNSLSCD